MLKRSGFRRQVLERKRAPLIGMRERRGVIAPVGNAVVSTPKLVLVDSEPYRRYVAALPCWRCSVWNHSQAAHGDMDKGKSMKTCDLTCYPACGPHDHLPGCHYIIGSTGTYPREERRAMEKQASIDTRAALVLQSLSDPVLHALLVKLGVTT